MDNKVKNLLLLSSKDLEWEKVIFSTKISDSGSTRPAMFYENKAGEVKPFRPSQKNLIFEIDDIAISNFKEFQNDPVKRFNKVEFEVFKDGSYKADYYWDEAEDIDQKLKTAEVFPIWLHERFLQFLFEAGYGDSDNWQKGIFKVQVTKEKTVLFDTMLFNKEIPFKADPEFPDYVFEAVLKHYEITNHGVLSDVFQQWDTLIIHSTHKSIDLEKDVKYNLGM